MRRQLFAMLCLLSIIFLSACSSKYLPGYSAGYEDGYRIGYIEGSNDIKSAGSNAPSRSVLSSVDYVLNTNSKKFHYPSCSSVDQMSEKNRQYYNGSRQEIIDMGYSPCGRCKP